MRPAGAGCVEALAEERAVLLALWVVHRPPSATCRLLALRLLHALAPAPAAAWAAAAHAGALYLLAALLPPPAAASAAERARARRPHRLRPAAGRPRLGPRAPVLALPLLWAALQPLHNALDGAPAHNWAALQLWRNLACGPGARQQRRGRCRIGLI